MRRLVRRSKVRLAGAVCLAVAIGLPSDSPARRTAGVVRVSNEVQFAAAVTALRDTGGTIVLERHDYSRTLVVPPRSDRLLQIVGRPGARVGRLLLDHTQHVSVGWVTIEPEGGDAWIDVGGSSTVVLHDLVVTARGTRYSASVVAEQGRHVVLRSDTFTHCGDRSPDWANCVLVGQALDDITIADSWFHDCLGCDFVHGRFGRGLRVLHNRFERALPCSIGRVRCGHQDLIELFAGRGLVVEGNHFGVYRVGGAELYLTNATDDVRIVNNLFIGVDPSVPGYRARIGIIVGSRGTARLPLDVVVANNTILTGARRADGYLGSIRMSARYGSVPRRERPILANNVIAVLESTWPVCRVVRVSSSNVMLAGRRCSPSDRVGDPHLDRRGRPTRNSALLLGRADPRYAPRTDITGRRRHGPPDIGAYQYPG